MISTYYSAGGTVTSARDRSYARATLRRSIASSSTSSPAKPTTSQHDQYSRAAIADAIDSSRQARAPRIDGTRGPGLCVEHDDLQSILVRVRPASTTREKRQDVWRYNRYPGSGRHLPCDLQLPPCSHMDAQGSQHGPMPVWQVATLTTAPSSAPASRLAHPRSGSSSRPGEQR